MEDSFYIAHSHQTLAHNVDNAAKETSTPCDGMKMINRDAKTDDKIYTVILKDSYTLTPNLNMKKWF